MKSERRDVLWERVDGGVEEKNSSISMFGLLRAICLTSSIFNLVEELRFGSKFVFEI